MTRQPRKQRTRTERAPLHERQRQVRATLTPELREKHGIRNVRVNAGDTVEVMRGDHAGTEGEVTEVDLTATAVFVEGVTTERADGEEVPRALPASNIRVTDLDLSDDVRKARLEGDSNE